MLRIPLVLLPLLSSVVRLAAPSAPTVTSRATSAASAAAVGDPTGGARELLSAVACPGHRLRLRITPGLAGAGHWSSVIGVANTGPSPCRLSGYPEVRLFNAGGMEVAEAEATPTGFSGGIPAGASIPSTVLQKGEVASAVMEGIDMPPGNARSCPSYPSYTITLPLQRGAVTFHRRMETCGLSVHPFVVGFNGSFPTGEVVGRALACTIRASGSSGIGPVVQIDAWSGRTLAGSVMLFPGTGSRSRYDLVLKPGTYRIRSAHERSVRAVIRVGRTLDLGSYGQCEPAGPMPTTVPGRSTPTTTPPSSE